MEDSKKALIDALSDPEIEKWFDSLPTTKCECGREYPILPMYFNDEGKCLVCSQK